MSDKSIEQNEQTQPVRIKTDSNHQPPAEGLPAWLEGLEDELATVPGSSPSDAVGMKNEEVMTEETQPLKKTADPTIDSSADWTDQGAEGVKNEEIQAAQTNQPEPEDEAISEQDKTSSDNPGIEVEEAMRLLRKDLASHFPASQIARELVSLTNQRPENPVLWLALGDIHSRNHDYQSALEAYKKASALINTPASGE